MKPEDVKRHLDELTREVGRFVVGAETHVRLSFIAILVKGHILLEGVPGTGKTMFAHCLSRALGLGMRRLQCTPDLMPGDVLGANLFDFRAQTFNLTKGPVFTELLLSDEINRTPPKTQSALLEAMQERSVTIDGTTHALSSRFTVFATQNPVEQEGTYPLPEAQLDRFLFKLVVGYPSKDEEVRAVIAHGGSAGMPVMDVRPIFSGADIDALRELPATVHLEPKVAEYVVDLSRATREHPNLTVGLSPRASAVLTAAARAAALTQGRDYVVPDDVKMLFVPLAHHRVIRTPSAEMEGSSVDGILEEILGQLRPPR